jgi:two-component system, cell cycle response regulator DivK
LATGHAVVIEDNEGNAEVLERLLKVEGMQVTVIRQPQQVESVLRTLQRIDVVFLDLEMPQMNGYDVFALLKQQLRLTAPVVACTVHLNEIVNVRETGFDGFLGKPLDGERFSQQLLRILNRESVWEIS